MPRRALEPEKFPFFEYRRFTFSLGIAARGSVWLSGSTAVCFDVERRSMVVAGDLLAQAGVIFEKMQTVLAAGQLRLSDIYRVVRYVTPAALPDLGRLNEAQARALGMPRSCSTVVVKSLLRPGALIEIEAVAGIASDSIDYLPSVFAPDGITARDRVQATLGVRGEILRTAEFVTPGTKWSKPRQPVVTSALRIGSPRLSQSGAGAQVDVVVAHGPRVPLVFVSAEGNPAGDNIVDQTRNVYDRLSTQLAGLGLGLDCVVKTTEFITSAALAQYGKTGDIRREIFAPPYPAATGVICDRLPDERTMIAVEAVASREAR